MNFVNVGSKNLIAQSRIVAIIAPESAPSKRLVQDARTQGRVVDCTGGHKIRCIILTDSEHVILSSTSSETIQSRINDTNGK